MEQQEKTKHT